MKFAQKIAFIVIVTNLLLSSNLFSVWALRVKGQPTFSARSTIPKPDLSRTSTVADGCTTLSATTVYLPTVLLNLPGNASISNITQASAIKIGQVTDVGGIDDSGFNEFTWNGLQDAATDFGVQISFLESQQESDYANNINQFIQQNYGLVLTVGSLMADDTQIAAEANPNSRFAIVDVSHLTATNILQSHFAVDEASFLAGYLAAGVSETGKVGTFGGMNIPSVVQFMVDFEQGVIQYNQVHSTTVEVLGWSTESRDGLFTGNFDSLDDGRTFAENLFDQGADIIFPVAGPVGLGAAVVAQERGLMIIGPDIDWYNIAPEIREVFLTSVVKRVDRFSYEATKTVVEDTFTGHVFDLNFANSGVELADYHDNADKVSCDLQEELDQLKEDLTNGNITTCWAEYTQNQPCQL